jgi:pimeloyl-ACP methyl ester carboxylesterase
MNWQAWDSVIPILERTHAVFAPTLPGHSGGPVIPAGSVGIGPFVDAVEKQLDELGWQRAHVVGNSLGGWVALELARRGRAESVVFLAPAGAPRSKAAFFRVVVIMRLAHAFSRLPGAHWLVRFRTIRRLMIRMMAADPDVVSRGEVSELLRNTSACTALDDLLAGMDAGGSLSSLETSIPARVAWPRRDRTLPWKSYGAPFCDLVPGATSVFLDGVGHVPMLDDPVLVAQTILEVTSLEAPRSA